MRASNTISCCTCLSTACLDVDCDAFLAVDSEVHLDNPQTLRLLLQHNK